MEGTASIMKSDHVDDQARGDADEPLTEECAETAGPDADWSNETPSEMDPRRVVEAILMASDTQLPAAKIATIMGSGTARDVRKHIESLNEHYDEIGASFRIEEIAGGYQILTRPEYNGWLTKLLRVRQETKLSAAAMETLAVVAYKQPCTRAEIEAVRGVAAGDMLNKLREMNLVKIVGRAEDLGRPILYGTTRRFLEVFGLPSLEDLPQVEALKLAPSAGPSNAAELPDDHTADLDDQAGDDRQVPPVDMKGVDFESDQSDSPPSADQPTES